MRQHFHFDSVSVFGRVGNDAIGNIVVVTLADAGVRVLLGPSKSASTGLAIHLRDSASGASKGVRLLLVDRGANLDVNLGDVELHAATMRGSDVFFVDGYCLLEEPRRGAAQQAMIVAREGGALVAFDLVPHNAHRFFVLREVAEWFDRAHIVIAEVRTIRRVLGLMSEDEVRDEQVARETWRVLRRAFPGKSFWLRFGAGNIDQTLYCQPESRA